MGQADRVGPGRLDDPDDVAVDADDDDDDEGTPQSSFSHWDVWNEAGPAKPLRQLPSIAVSAMRFVWRANRFSSLITLGNDLVAALAGGMQVLVVGALLDRLVGDQPVDRAVRDAAPWVAVLVVTQLASSLFNAVVRGRAELFQERVGLAANMRVLSVASNVDLLGFESPTFFDRLQRVQEQARFRPMQVVQSTNQLLSGRARRRWPSCSAGSTGRPRARSAGTGSTRPPSSPMPSTARSPSSSRTSSGTTSRPRTTSAWATSTGSTTARRSRTRPAMPGPTP